jgi:serine/threonine-protein kinase
VKLCPSCFEPFPDDAKFCPFDGKELTKTNDRFLGRTIASRYRLIKRLGSGGMSVVYLARHELISRLSAIKILRPELSRIAEHRERFLREARAVNRINHENIVEITDVGESDGVAYLVMEYVEGEPLLAHVQRGRLAWDRGVRIAMQVAAALARAHQEGIVHRDLKPENILLVPPKNEGGFETAKLTDFGIAKVMGEPSITMNEQLFGTPGYIAPEYVGGLSIDGRSDLYSLAVVLYEMVTGQLPFEGRGQSELLLKPLTNAPIPPSQRVSDLPPDLETLLLRGLARDPAERHHDAFAFHDALGDLLRRFKKATVPPPNMDFAAEPREPLSTMIDSVTSIETAEVAKIVTSEMSSRWSAALAELETLIANARKQGGAHAKAAQCSRGSSARPRSSAACRRRST